MNSLFWIDINRWIDINSDSSTIIIDEYRISHINIDNSDSSTIIIDEYRISHFNIDSN